MTKTTLKEKVQEAVTAAANDPVNDTFAAWAARWLAGEATRSETRKECLRLDVVSTSRWKKPPKYIKAYAAVGAAGWYRPALEDPSWHPSEVTEVKCIERLCRMAHTGLREPKVGNLTENEKQAFYKR